MFTQLWGQRRAPIVGLLALLLLAFGLRVYGLEVQSLWPDEAASLFLSRRDLWAITLGAASDIHPPLYYYLLHFWIAVAGDGEFGVRSFSVVVGTLTIAATFALGRLLLGRQVALLAALFAALSPFQVYYSQETRMYATATLLALFSIHIFTKLLPRDSAFRWWLGYTTVSTFLVYTHYAAFAIIVAQNLLVLVSGHWRRRDFLWRWCVAQGIILLLFLPWLGIALNQVGQRVLYSAAPGIASHLKQSTTALGMGLAADSQAVWLVVGLLWLPVIAAIVAGFRRGQDVPVGLLCLWLFAPLVLLYLFSTFVRPFYHPKFLLPAAPAYSLLLAYGVIGGMGWLRRERGWWRRASIGWTVVFGSLAVAVALYGLSGYYFDTRYARDDWRSLAKRIELLSRPTDGIIVVAPGLTEIFSYYYRGKALYYGLPRPDATEAETAQELQGMMARHGQLWVVLWGEAGDPARTVERWLDAHASEVADRWYGNLRLVMYISPCPLALQQTVQATFGTDIQLLGYGVDPRELPADDILGVVLRWKAQQAPDESYTVFLHLVDDRGRVWGQRDSEPVGGSKPTDTWEAGEEVIDRLGLEPLPGTPPGDYHLLVGLYSRRSSYRLPVSGEPALQDAVSLGSIRITAPKRTFPLEILSIGHSLTLDTNGIRLLGYDLSGDNQPLAPGDVLEVVLYWQATEPPKADLAISLVLVDSGGRTIGEQQGRPADGRFPTTRWQPGQLIRDRRDITVDAAALSGNYRLQLAIRDATTDAELVPNLGMVTIRVVAHRQFSIPKMQRRLSASLGNVVELLGYDLEVPEGQRSSARPLVIERGRELSITLYWKAQARMEKNYTVFTHVLDGSLRIIGQSDSWPAMAQRPTTSWAVGEVVTDRRVLKIAEDAPSGEGEIEVGMYLTESGERLPVLDSTGKVVADRVLLERVVVK